MQNPVVESGLGSPEPHLPGGTRDPRNQVLSCSAELPPHLLGPLAPIHEVGQQGPGTPFSWELGRGVCVCVCVCVRFIEWLQGWWGLNM